MHGMTGDLQHGGKKYTWWAGSSDRESEWVVHCRHETLGVSRYLTGKVDEKEAQKLAEGLAPLVEGLTADDYRP
ncbi:MAG TPA: hypothetical protein VF210_00875 [Pseudomonadales bacterium]